MIPTGFWRYLHLLFAFAYVGSLIVLEWNGRVARATQVWGERAILFEVCRRAASFVGIPSLFLLGVLGNLLAVSLGYRMANDPWMQISNLLWIVSLVVFLSVSLPGSSKLEALARAGGGPAWNRMLARWRIANGVLSLLFIALLGVMVFRWKS